jgi:hypothetical protein
MTGSAKLGTDYSLSGDPGQIVIPAGQSSGSVTLTASSGASVKKQKKKAATMMLRAGSSYKVSKSKKATVTIVP